MVGISGNRLFVQEYQCPPPPIKTFATIDDGVIIIDTNGVFQGVYNKSRVTGKWNTEVADRLQTVACGYLMNRETAERNCLKCCTFDSLGNLYPSQYYGIQHGHYTTLADFHIMPDSTLVTATEGYFDIMVMDPLEQRLISPNNNPTGRPFGHTTIVTVSGLHTDTEITLDPHIRFFRKHLPVSRYL